MKLQARSVMSRAPALAHDTNHVHPIETLINMQTHEECILDKFKFKNAGESGRPGKTCGTGNLGRAKTTSSSPHSSNRNALKTMRIITIFTLRIVQKDHITRNGMTS